MWDFASALNARLNVVRDTRHGPRTERVVYESIIKVNVADEPWKRAKDIADGIGYACALLLDEYEWTAEGITVELERVTDEIQDEWEQRHPEGDEG